MRHLFVLVLTIVSVAACGSSVLERQMADAREEIKNNLRDPASAEFKQERIRVLWTTKGDRRKVNCSKVNSANAFGGKTGFYWATVTLEKKVEGDVPWDYEYDKVGRVAIESGNGLADNPKFYLDCEREDTQRDALWGGIIPLLYGRGDAMRAAIDKDFPIRSIDIAPELR